jgi:hypothetical protein
MLLGFKRRFAPFVEEGSKTHTIRGVRKITPRVGEVCHCYVNPRQKTMRLLGRWACVKVEPIVIYECADGRFSVIVDGNELTPDEKDVLAWMDGFRDSGKVYGAFTFMMRYWVETHGDGRIIDVNYRGEPFAPNHRKALAFEGHLIHWRFVAGTGKRKAAAC